jgi:hypothetical protein
MTSYEASLTALNRRGNGHPPSGAQTTPNFGLARTVEKLDKTNVEARRLIGSTISLIRESLTAYSSKARRGMNGAAGSAAGGRGKRQYPATITTVTASHHHHGGGDRRHGGPDHRQRSRLRSPQ